MHLDIPVIGQSYLLFRARLLPPYALSTSATPESLAVSLVSPADIPWSDIAFSSVQIALRAFCEDMESGRMSFHHGVVKKTAGAAPNDPGSFELVDHFAYQLAEH
jgi:ADP-ribose/FAD diphosphatase